MTRDEINEVLRLHEIWLRDERRGKRADLSGADLRGANLSGANLRGASLSDAKGIIRVGPASDGYEFFGVVRDGVAWIRAGCRWLTVENARKHWTETRADTPLGRERILFVDFIEAHFEDETD